MNDKDRTTSYPQNDIETAFQEIREWTTEKRSEFAKFAKQLCKMYSRDQMQGWNERDYWNAYHAWETSEKLDRIERTIKEQDKKHLDLGLLFRNMCNYFVKEYDARKPK